MLQRISLKLRSILLDQTLVRLPQTIYQAQPIPLPPCEIQTCWNPAEAMHGEPPHLYLITPNPTVTQVLSDHPGLPSAGILLGRFTENPSSTCCVLLVISPHPCPHPRSLLLGYKSPLLQVVLWELKLVLCWSLSSPIAGIIGIKNSLHRFNFCLLLVPLNYTYTHIYIHKDTHICNII